MGHFPSALGISEAQGQPEGKGEAHCMWRFKGLAFCVWRWGNFLFPFVGCHFQGLLFSPTTQKTVTCCGTQKHHDYLSFAACGKHRLLLGLMAKCGDIVCGLTIGTIWGPIVHKTGPDHMRLPWNVFGLDFLSFEQLPRRKETHTQWIWSGFSTTVYLFSCFNSQVRPSR